MSNESRITPAVLQSLVASIDDGLMMLNSDWQIVYLNERSAEILGKPAQDLLGHNLWKIFPEAIDGPLHVHTHAAIAQQSVVQFDHYCQTQARWFEQRIYPSPQGLTILSLDIESTSRKQTEALLKQINTNLTQQVQEHMLQLNQAIGFEATLKRITDKVRDSLDEAHILQAVVQELVYVTGVQCCNSAVYDLEQSIATIRYEHTTTTWSFQGKVVKMADFVEGYAQLLQGQYFQFCPLVVPPNEDQKAVLACPILDDQEVLGDLWLIHEANHQFHEQDIRLLQQVANQCAIAIRQARLYESSQNQVQELEHLNRLKDEFLNTVSHELRTPIANIKMASRMLEVIFQQGGLPAATATKAERYLQILRNECDREINLVGDLLDLSRLEANVDSLLLSSMPLQDWIPHLAEPFLDRIQSQQQHLQIKIPTDLPLILSDLDRLGRIITELLNNACKYTSPSEKICIEVHQQAEQMVIQISNSGVEIPPAEQTRIFDKFYRIPNNDPWKYGGTGLGLALVKKLTEQVQGSIEASSKAGWTTFTLKIPVSIEQKRLNF